MLNQFGRMLNQSPPRYYAPQPAPYPYHPAPGPAYGQGPSPAYAPAPGPEYGMTPGPTYGSLPRTAARPASPREVRLTDGQIDDTIRGYTLHLKDKAQKPIELTAYFARDGKSWSSIASDSVVAGRWRIASSQVCNDVGEKTLCYSVFRAGKQVIFVEPRSKIRLYLTSQKAGDEMAFASNEPSDGSAVLGHTPVPGTASVASSQWPPSALKDKADGVIKELVSRMMTLLGQHDPAEFQQMEAQQCESAAVKSSCLLAAIFSRQQHGPDSVTRGLLEKAFPSGSLNDEDLTLFAASVAISPLSSPPDKEEARKWLERYRHLGPQFARTANTFLLYFDAAPTSASSSAVARVLNEPEPVTPTDSGSNAPASSVMPAPLFGKKCPDIEALTAALITDTEPAWRDITQTLVKAGLHPNTPEDVLLFSAQVNPQVMKDPVAKASLTFAYVVQAMTDGKRHENLGAALIYITTEASWYYNYSTSILAIHGHNYKMARLIADQGIKTFGGDLGAKLNIDSIRECVSSLTPAE